LLDWISKADGEQNGIFLVHGEPEASAQLAKLIEKRLRFDVTIPEHEQTFSL